MPNVALAIQNIGTLTFSTGMFAGIDWSRYEPAVDGRVAVLMLSGGHAIELDHESADALRQWLDRINGQARLSGMPERMWPIQTIGKQTFLIELLAGVNWEGYLATRSVEMYLAGGHVVVFEGEDADGLKMWFDQVTGQRIQSVGPTGLV